MTSVSLCIDEEGAVLWRPGQSFDPLLLEWRDATSGAPGGRAATPVEAVQWLFHEAPNVRRVPIGIIGSREASEDQMRLAEQLGRRLAELGLTLLCGGRTGVMEAACKGCAEAGGQPIGLLPDEHWSAANPYVAIPIASGVREARNAIIARACLALVAVGGGYGTLSEVALGLQFGRPILALAGAPEVAGVERFDAVEPAVERLCELILGLK